MALALAAPGHPCSLHDVKSVVRQTYKQTAPLTKRDARRIAKRTRCLERSDRSDLHHFRNKMRAWRRSYRGYWNIQVRRQPGVHARLAGLRYCESTGRYHISGAHDGAYQYLRSTWARAQWWVPYRYRTAAAHLASVDHQDAVTGRFYPSHAGEWACSA